MEGIYNSYFSSNFAAVYFIGVDFDKGLDGDHQWQGLQLVVRRFSQIVSVFELTLITSKTGAWGSPGQLTAIVSSPLLSYDKPL